MIFINNNKKAVVGIGQHQDNVLNIIKMVVI